MGRRRCHRHHIILFNPLGCFFPPKPAIAQTAKTIASQTPVKLAELTSPIVGCMGQIKKCNNKKVQPASSVSSTSSRTTPISDEKEIDVGRQAVSLVVNMDVPLPVVKKCQVRETLRGNLWARRCGGDKAEGVKLQHLGIEMVAVS